MLTIQFLDKHIIDKNQNIWDYVNCNYEYHYRDFMIDYKYVYYTIYKNKILCYEKCTLGKYLKMAYIFSPAEITHICEKTKSLFCNNGTFKIIEGDDIANAYYRENYVPSHGTLNNSCMRYLKCQKNNYFDIYKDHAKMLIMTPKRGKRILGRAILWPYGDSYLMDRVYTTEPFIEYQFYKYAEQMKWGHLDKNIYVHAGSIQNWRLPDDNYSEPRKLKISIDLQTTYNNVPFMDSFCYMSLDETKLSTYPKEKIACVLHSTSGRKVTMIC